MSLNVFKNIKEALANLNPQEVREHVERPLRLLLYADDEAGYRRMEAYFAPAALSLQKRQEVERVLLRASQTDTQTFPNDIAICLGRGGEERLKQKTAVFIFDPANPEHTIHEVLK